MHGKIVALNEVRMFHLVQGDDDYRIASKRDEIAATFLGKGDAAIEHYDGGDRDFTMTSLYQAISTQSFFEPRKIIIVDEGGELINREKKFLSSDQGLRIFEDLVKIGDDVLTIFTAVEKTVAKNTKIYKIISEHGKVMEMKKFWHDPNEGVTGELKKWIESEAKKRGLKLPPAQLNIVVTRSGSDLRQIANELDKILLFLGGESQTNIDDASIRALIPAGRELMVFHLIDAVGQKNKARALAYTGDLINAGTEPSFIVMMLHRHLKQLFAVQILKKDKMSDTEIAKELELSDFKRRKLLSQMDNFPRGTLPRMINALAKADEEVKTSSLPGKLIVEKLIVKLAG